MNLRMKFNFRIVTNLEIRTIVVGHFENESNIITKETDEIV